MKVGRNDGRRVITECAVHGSCSKRSSAPPDRRPVDHGDARGGFHSAVLPGLLSWRRRCGRDVFVPGADRPEESTHDVSVRPRWPFLEVRELLETAGVRVPRLLGEDTEHGWLLVEDLGDETLAARIEAHPDERASSYTKAVRDLASARRRFLVPSRAARSSLAGASTPKQLLFWEARALPRMGARRTRQEARQGRPRSVGRDRPRPGGADRVVAP